MPGRSWPGSAGASPPDEQPFGGYPGQHVGAGPVLRVNTQDSLLVTPAEFGEGDPAPPPRVLVSGNFRDPLLGVPGDPPVVDQPDGHRVEEMQLLPRAGELLGTVGPRHRSRNPQRNQHHGRAGAGPYGGSQRSTPLRSPSKAASSHLRRTNRDHSHRKSPRPG